MAVAVQKYRGGGLFDVGRAGGLREEGNQMILFKLVGICSNLVAT